MTRPNPFPNGLERAIFETLLAKGPLRTQDILSSDAVVQYRIGEKARVREEGGRPWSYESCVRRLKDRGYVRYPKSGMQARHWVAVFGKELPVPVPFKAVFGKLKK